MQSSNMGPVSSFWPCVMCIPPCILAVKALALRPELVAEPPAAAGTPGTSAHATAVAPDEEMLDIATSELEPDDGADADMQTQPAQEPNHVSISHSDLSYDNMADAPLGDDSLADAPMDDDSIPDTELYEGTPPGPPPPHMPVPDCFQSGMEEEEQGQELQPVTQLAPFFAAEELDASCPSDSQKAGLHPARGSPSPSGRRSPAATG